MPEQSSDFGALFRREAAALLRFAERRLGAPQEAEDAVHDAFLKLMRRGDRPADFDNPRAWMFSVVRSVCEDRRRASARRDRLFVTGAADAPDPAVWGRATPEAALADRDALAIVEAAMAELAPEEAEALTLVVSDGFSYQAVARITGAPIGTVRSRIHRARQRLRAALEAGEAAEATQNASGRVLTFRRPGR